MKITMEATTRISQSPLGMGRVWHGTTDQGTPVKVLVSGLAADSDDPEVEAQFDREHEALPDEEGPLCPDCGQPMELHELAAMPVETERHLRAEVDLYEVIARWLMAYGSEMVPPETNEAELAEHLRQHLKRRDPGHHDRLMNAAKVTALYIARRVLQEAAEIKPTTHETGHA